MTEAHNITPKNDIIFKMIFGNPRHERVLVHFLNSVIKPKSLIRSVNITGNEPTSEHAAQRGVRFDIVATTNDGEIVNIEMQKKDEKDIIGRSLFYWSKLFFGQLEVGSKFGSLKRTISINILDFKLFKEDERYWRKGYLKDDVSDKKFTDLLEMHFIELDKMGKVDRGDAVTFWIEFLKNPYSEEMESLCEYVPEIKEAKEIFEKAVSESEAQEELRIQEKAAYDYGSDMATARDEGLAKLSALRRGSYRL